VRALLMVAALSSGCTLIFDGSDLHGTGGGTPDMSVVEGDMAGGGGDMTGGGGDMTGGGGDMTGGSPDMLKPLPTVEFTKTAASPIQIATGPYFMAAGDLDGDGNLDLVTANNVDDNFSFLFGNGMGGFSVTNDRPAGIPTTCSIYALAVGKFNNDARADVAFTCTDGNTNNAGGVLLFNANRTYSLVANSDLGPGTETDLQFMTAADVDNDTNLDLVVTAQAINQVWVLLGNGNGTFKAKKTITVGTTPYWAAVGRLNGDNLLDIVTANYGGNNFSAIVQTSAGVFPANGTAVTGPNEPAAVVLGEFTGDANNDIALASVETAMTSVTVVPGNGMGGFSAAKPPMAVGVYPYAMTTGEINRDGRADIVTANGVADNCSLLVSDGMGGFKTAMTLACGVGPADVVIADVNKDGLPDILVADRSVPAGVTILLNTSH
jgi:hypothetical protein